MKRSSDDVLFYTCRHGRTKANDEDIYRAWSNAPEAQLDDSGRFDSDEAGKFFDRNLIPVKVIITDDLERTQETANRIATVLSITDQVFTTPSLRPLNMGDWTLKSKKEFPIDDFIKNPSRKIPGGESVGEFNERQREAFSKVLKVASTIKNGFVLVVGHGSNNSFLKNHLYNRSDAPVVGYEGLVDPGGILMATDSNLCPLTKIREKNNSFGIPNFHLPSDHKPWIKVPKGGSSCANCEYVSKDLKKCKNEGFIKFTGSDKLPLPADQMCSDWWEPK